MNQKESQRGEVPPSAARAGIFEPILLACFMYLFVTYTYSWPDDLLHNLEGTEDDAALQNRRSSSRSPSLVTF